MRGSDGYNESLFSTVRLEDFVPASHPLRPIRQWVNEALAGMDESLSAMSQGLAVAVVGDDVRLPDLVV